MLLVIFIYVLVCLSEQNNVENCGLCGLWWNSLVGLLSG